MKFVPDRTKPAEVERARLMALYERANAENRDWDTDMLSALDSELFDITDTPNPGEPEVMWRDDT